MKTSDVEQALVEAFDSRGVVPSILEMVSICLFERISLPG